jgi:hypothetical protein
MKKQAPLKIIGVLIMFAALHFAYELVPIFPFKVIAGISESNFQHMKLAFFAYLFTSILEYFFVRKSLASVESFVYSRFFATTLLPWMMISIWYMQAVFFGPMLLTIELIYSTIIVLIATGCAIIVERAIENKPLTAPFKGLIIGLFLIAFIEYAVFSFKLPWLDLFTGHIEHDH